VLGRALRVQGDDDLAHAVLGVVGEADLRLAALHGVEVAREELTQVAEALRFRSAGGFGADLLHRAGEAFAAGTERLHDSAADRLRAPRELPVCEERLGSLGEGE